MVYIMAMEQFGFRDDSHLFRQIPPTLQSSRESLENLRKEFAAILKLYNDIVAKKTVMDTKIGGIKEVYNGLVKTHSTRTFLFCLDSLFFQYKILNLELEHYNKKVALLQNRMYGDYYKLHLLILTQTRDAGIVLSSSSREPRQEFPVYKDIDPFYKYKLEDIIAIHDCILSILGELYAICEEKTANIKQHRDSIAVGASLLIFVNAMEHERDVLFGHIQLFSRYLEFYHQSNARYLDNLYRDMVDFYANLEDSVLINLEDENFESYKMMYLAEEANASEAELVCLEGAQGEAIAEPYTNSYEDSTPNVNNSNTFLMEDIYGHDENLPPIQYDNSCNLASEATPLPPNTPNSAFGLDEDIASEQSPIDNEETAGPFLDLQMLGSQHLADAHTSSTGTIVYIEPQDSGEPKETEYIPQNITMEICDDEVVNEEVDLDVDLEPTSQDYENVSII